MTKQIAGNPAVNALILECFGLIGDHSVEQHYLKRFRNECHDNWQVMNSVRELVIGGYFAAKGYKTTLARFDGPTPDWRIDRGNVHAIVEVFTKYADTQTFGTLTEGKMFVPVNQDRDVARISDTLREKATKYRLLAERESLRVIVASALDLSFFTAAAELRKSLPDVMAAEDIPASVSGCLVYERLNGLHRFDWIANGKEPGIVLPVEDRAATLTDFGEAARAGTA